MADQPEIQIAPRRWAKVLVVNGVLATVIHEYDGDVQHYAINTTIKTTAGTTLVSSMHQDEPFQQYVFDLVGDEVVHNLIAHAHWLGLTPLQVSDGENFTAMKHGSWICAATVDYQVAALDLALNGKRTPGVTLGMLLHQVRDAGGVPAVVAPVLLEALEAILQVEQTIVGGPEYETYPQRYGAAMDQVRAAVKLARGGLHG